MRRKLQKLTVRSKISRSLSSGSLLGVVVYSGAGSAGGSGGAALWSLFTCSFYAFCFCASCASKKFNVCCANRRGMFTVREDHSGDQRNAGVWFKPAQHREIETDRETVETERELKGKQRLLIDFVTRSNKLRRTTVEQTETVNELRKRPRVKAVNSEKYGKWKDFNCVNGIKTLMQ